MQNLHKRMTHQQEPEAESIIAIGLETASSQAASFECRPVNILAYEKLNLVAGAIGYTAGTTLVVQSLWVDAAFRSNGVARGMMADLENEAQGRGAKTAFVDAMSYQAPDFFKKIGYSEVTRIPGFHLDHDRVILRKDLN